MPVNATHEYSAAEKKYLAAKTTEEKIIALEDMIREAPRHKGSENMLANLKSRLSRLKQQLEDKKQAKKSKSNIETIKKTGDALVVLIGLANSGKSSLLKALTNANPKISEWPYTTTKPEQGVFDYGGCKIQLVELPSLRNNIEIDARNLSIARTSDLIAMTAVGDEEINKVLDELRRAKISTQMLIIHTKSDTILKVPSKADISVSALANYNIDELKDRIFLKLKLIRIFTKEHYKKTGKIPIILKQGSSIYEFAEKISREFIMNFNYALVWGKSVKFQGQRCGIEHKLKDLDVVEIYLKK